MNKKIVIVLLFAAVILLTSGCIIQINKGGTTSGASGTLGGVFMSPDKMETWQSKSKLITSNNLPAGQAGATAYFNNTDVSFLHFDPTDSKTIYAGTRADGLFYTNNSGEGWLRAGALTQGFVRDVAVDPKNKCTLYAAVDQRIYKSVDCAKTWKTAWYSGNAANVAAALGVDWYDSAIVYAGLADGTLAKSDDRGVSWTVANKFDHRVNKIVVDPRDSNNVYAGVLNEGLYKSSDKGENWTSLLDAMKGFAGANIYYDFALSKGDSGLIIYASQYGLLRSLDGGDTWLDLKLLTQPGAQVIYSLAIDPKNSKNIYYGTASTLYKTADAGESWVVKKMPTTRVPSALLVYPGDANVIFMGAKSIQQ